jgi:hypothetical protein
MEILPFPQILQKGSDCRSDIFGGGVGDVVAVARESDHVRVRYRLAQRRSNLRTLSSRETPTVNAGSTRPHYDAREVTERFGSTKRYAHRAQASGSPNGGQGGDDGYQNADGKRTEHDPEPEPG